MKNYNLKKRLSSSFYFKAFILISLKEIYFFLRNLYGLVFHPFKTVGGILKGPDWSQTILIFGLPGYFWFLSVVLFLPVFFFFRTHYDARILLLLLFYCLTVLLFLLGLYLLYWVARYFLRCKLKPKNS